MVPMGSWAGVLAKNQGLLQRALFHRVSGKPTGVSHILEVPWVMGPYGPRGPMYGHTWVLIDDLFLHGHTWPCLLHRGPFGAPEWPRSPMGHSPHSFQSFPSPNPSIIDLRSMMVDSTIGILWSRGNHREPSASCEGPQDPYGSLRSPRIPWIPKVLKHS